MKRPLTRAEEKKLLVAVLANLGPDQPQEMLTRIKRWIVGWALGVLFAVAVLGTFIEPNIYKVLLAGIAFAAGLCIGVSAWRLMATRQWPALAKCIDRSKVEARLRELDA